jgi:predicted  nucleic acid-binding Zn ribbon protein
MKMTFQEIRIITTGPNIANQLRDVRTICRRSWYIAAHIWKIYDFKVEICRLVNYRELKELKNGKN